tara:strand:- start:1630 stop:2898 length:1269 start_codon:yes stop_codon:yes gene_type:complete
VGILKKYKKNLLFRVIGYTGTAGVVRLLVGLVSQKAIAVFVGASGLALMANLRNLLEVLSSFSSLGTKNGLIAEAAATKDALSLKSLLNSIVSLFFGASILIALLLFWQQEWITSQLFFGESFGSLFLAILFAVPFMGLMVLIESILTGKKSFKAVSNLQLITASITAVFMIVLLWLYGLKGGICAILLRPIIGALLYFFYFKSSIYKSIIPNAFEFNISKVKALFPYMAMTVVSVGFVHAIELGLRTLISIKIDVASAGFWTAMNAISSNYFIFITAVFSLYVLPRYSEQNSEFQLLDESKDILKTLLPIVTFGMIMIYLFREPLTKLLFTVDFIGITSLFKWQLTADWFRVIFLVFAYYLVAKKRLVDFFIVEIFSFSTLICVSLLLIDDYGIEAIVIANAIRYVGCLILVVFLLRNKLK